MRPAVLTFDDHIFLVISLDSFPWSTGSNPCTPAISCTFLKPKSDCRLVGIYIMYFGFTKLHLFVRIWRNIFFTIAVCHKTLSPLSFLCPLKPRTKLCHIRMTHPTIRSYFVRKGKLCVLTNCFILKYNMTYALHYHVTTT